MAAVMHRPCLAQDLVAPHVVAQSLGQLGERDAESEAGKGGPLVGVEAPEWHGKPLQERNGQWSLELCEPVDGLEFGKLLAVRLP